MPAESVPVHYREGVSHGFLVVRTQDGKPIADGESTQIAQGDRVTDRMRFKFKDGSIYEETTVFSQRGTFRLLSNHVVQKGPLFKRTMETSIDATSGQVILWSAVRSVSMAALRQSSRKASIFSMAMLRQQSRHSYILGECPSL
jgi:hypothetical protein